MAQLFASLIFTYALAKLINQSDTKRAISYTQQQNKRKCKKIPKNEKLNNDKYSRQESNKLVLKQNYLELLRKLDLYTVQLIFKYLDILSLNDLTIMINKQKEIYCNLSKEIIKPSPNINKSLLNKNAAAFHPTLEEDANEWKLQRRLSLEQLRKYSRKSAMFIAQNITLNAIDDIKEYFETTQALFQYLRFRLIKNVIDGTYNLLSNSIEMIALFDVDLHKNENGEKLYVVGIENDADSTKKDAEKWKMKGFMTKQDIMSNYDIFCDLLPKEKINLSLDCHIEHFANLRIDIWCKLSVVRSSKQKKAKSKQKVTKSIQEFHKIVWNGINKNNFKKIIFIEPKRGSYKQQLLLPIELENNNWIAITFDFNHQNGNWDPHQICIDSYDIRQKMALYKPFENKNQYQWLQNEITDLQIINNNNYFEQERKEEICLKLKYIDLKQKYKNLQNENVCLKSENKDLRKKIENLKQ